VEGPSTPIYSLSALVQEPTSFITDDQRWVMMQRMGLLHHNFLASFVLVRTGSIYFCFSGDFLNPQLYALVEDSATNGDIKAEVEARFPLLLVRPFPQPISADVREGQAFIRYAYDLLIYEEYGLWFQDQAGRKAKRLKQVQEEVIRLNRRNGGIK
jgi:hypothetical protein